MFWPTFLLILTPILLWKTLLYRNASWINVTQLTLWASSILNTLQSHIKVFKLNYKRVIWCSIPFEKNRLICFFCSACDWMVFNSHFLNFYQTDSYAIFIIVFTSLFKIIISKPISSLSDKTRRKKFWKKVALLRLSADLAFWITRTKCMQKRKWVEHLSNRPS